MWQVIDITYTCLHYRHELSVTLSICIKSLFAMYFWRPSFKRPNSTSNWLCSKLLVTYPDRGGQANHFWHSLFLLSFSSQLSSAQQRGVSAKFYNNIFYSQWLPLTDKTTKKNMCPHLTHRLSDLLLNGFKGCTETFSAPGLQNPVFCLVVRFSKNYIFDIYSFKGICGCKNFPRQKVSGFWFLPILIL